MPVRFRQKAIRHFKMKKEIEKEKVKEKETERTFGSIGRGFIDLENH